MHYPISPTGKTILRLLFPVLWVLSFGLTAQTLNNQPVDGYRGIWFELGQPLPYGDKYSGGLATYTAKHMPLAIYAEAVDKTFFVYGGTRAEDERHLLCMIGVYDHRRERLHQPTVVYDKQGVDDPHDNPSLTIDSAGYLWVFVSGRNTHRPGIKLRSRQPYDASAFDEVSQETFTYPQIWYGDEGFFHFFTKYTGIRELYFEKSKDGIDWTEDQKLAGIREAEGERAGHYQVSGQSNGGQLIGTFFNRHPDGDVDRRTDLYYLQSENRGEEWTNVHGTALATPLDSVASPARVIDYAGQGLNVYLKDMRFDEAQRPVCLYLTSKGHEPGPDNAPYLFRVTYFDGQAWQTETVCEADHNYDMGSLFLPEEPGGKWTVIVPSDTLPQGTGVGGELQAWERDAAGKWGKVKQLTANSPRNPSYLRRVINGRPPFQMLWCDADPHNFGRSQLYFGDRSGRVFAMPYDMRQQSVRLRKLEVSGENAPSAPR